MKIQTIAVELQAVDHTSINKYGGTEDRPVIHFEGVDGRSVTVVFHSKDQLARFAARWQEWLKEPY